MEYRFSKPQFLYFLYINSNFFDASKMEFKQEAVCIYYRAWRVNGFGFRAFGHAPISPVAASAPPAHQPNPLLPHNPQGIFWSQSVYAAMADLEGAARAPPPPPPVAVAPPPPAPRTAAAAAKAALGDVVVYSFLSAMFVACAASIALVVARYTVGGGYPYAYAVVASVARHAFLPAFLVVEMFCPFTVLVLVLRLARRQPELPEELLLVRDSDSQPVPRSFLP